MLFSYNWLQEFFKTKLPGPEKLAELLAFHVFECEGIAKHENDYILDVSILPQRGDCLSHEGIAREISAITKQPLEELPLSPIKIQKGILKPLKVSIAASRFVQRYSALVVEGVTIGPSPQWLKERLIELGVNSINNVVDITNFVMLELGQPLHAFDYQKIHGEVMTIRESKAGQAIELLDDNEISLQKGALVIEDFKGVIDLAGIKGGKATGITKSTKHIVLQAAVFDRQKIYQTKKALGYGTQAADMYAHGVDPYLTIKALERAFYLLLKFGGGKPVQLIDIYPAKKAQKSITFSSGVIEKLLGIKITDKEIKAILESLGFLMSGTKVKVPTWRQDVSLPEDLIEEVGRIYGYHNIEPAFPQALIVPPETNMGFFWQEQIRDIFREAGFTEAYNYSFVSKDSVLSADGVVELENPISEDFEYLRPNLLCNLLKNIELNQKTFSGKDIRIFEIGKVFEKTSKGIEEYTKIGGALSSSGGAFYEMKGVTDLFLSRLGIKNVWYNENKQAEKSASVIISQDLPTGKAGKEIGILQEISPHVAAFEIDFDAVVEHALEEREYQPPSKFPAALRDIALLVPRAVKVKNLLNVIKKAGGELVADIDLFDTYEGKGVPEGKRSFAFHIVYQSKERTLKNEEVDLLQKNIVKGLEENEEWKVRD